MEKCSEIKFEKQRNLINGGHKEGLTTWIFILFCFICVHIILENYVSYGIIKTPYDLTADYFDFLKSKGWVFPAIYTGLFVQSLLCYSIEITIIKEWISEKYGLLLHAFNTLFLLNLTVAIFLCYDIHSFAAIKLIGMPFFTSYKFWSFAWENKIYRENNKAQKVNGLGISKQGKQSKVFSPNLTVKNVLLFTMCSTSIIYNIQGVKRTKRSFRKLFEMIISSIAVHYVMAFLVHQYIFPELQVMFANYQQGSFLKAISSAFKLAVPIHIAWLLHYFVYCMWYLLRFPSIIWATDQDTIIYKDWWNAENYSVFWSKWNYQIHIWYKRYVFVPLLEMGYSKRFAAYSVGFVSGVFHEYLCTATTRIKFGILIFVMMSQIPLAKQSQFIQERMGASLANVFMITLLIIGHFINTVLWYNAFYG